MAASNASRPRPNKNSNGQDKKPQPTMSHDISISPSKPEPAPAPPPPPGAPLPGHTNPMTHPQHPTMQSNVTAGAKPPGGPMPGTAPAGPTADPADKRDVQERIQFKDLPPVGQSQAMQQQGIDPYAMFELGQQKVQGAMAQGPSSGPIPNALTGPGIPQDQGLESFPDDMAHLTTLMGQGYAPGASAQEHGLAQNAHALARAKITQAMSDAQQGAGAPQSPPAGPMLPQSPTPPAFGPPGPNPYAPPPGPPGTPPPMPPMGAPPALQSSLGAPPTPPLPPSPLGAGGPPSAPGAPGGIPPELIAALAKKKPLGAIR